MNYLIEKSCTLDEILSIIPKTGTNQTHPLQTEGVYIWVYAPDLNDREKNCEVHYVGKAADILRRNIDHSESQGSAQYSLPEAFLEEKRKNNSKTSLTTKPDYTSNKSSKRPKSYFSVIKNRKFYRNPDQIAEICRIGCEYRKHLTIYFIKSTNFDYPCLEAHLINILSPHYNLRKEPKAILDNPNENIIKQGLLEALNSNILLKNLLDPNPDIENRSDTLDQIKEKEEIGSKINTSIEKEGLAKSFLIA